MAHIVKIQDGFSFLPRPGETLLEALEGQEIAMEYQCRQGYCGSCQVKLVDGEIAYNEPPLAFVKDGHILPCCCQAKSDVTLELPQPVKFLQRKESA